ncbi:MAG: hypothetical protein H0T78_08340 [Longispora sp.]|nr:hypothetical protein [Longispora sp. (in: high G+C Gram-positive bacteria)]
MVYVKAIIDGRDVSQPVMVTSAEEARPFFGNDWAEKIYERAMRRAELEVENISFAGDMITVYCKREEITGATQELFDFITDGFGYYCVYASPKLVNVPFFLPKAEYIDPRFLAVYEFIRLETGEGPYVLRTSETGPHYLTPQNVDLQAALDKYLWELGLWVDPADYPTELAPAEKVRQSNDSLLHSSAITKGLIYSTDTGGLVVYYQLPDTKDPGAKYIRETGTIRYFKVYGAESEKEKRIIKEGIRNSPSTKRVEFQ